MSAQSQHLPMPHGRRFGSVSAAFAAAGVAIALITILAFWGVVWVRDSATWRDHTYKVLARADDVYSALREAEATQRGYFVTGDNRPLEQYRQSRDAIPAAMNALRELTADNPAQQMHLAELDPLLRRRIAQMDAAVDTRQAGDFASLARQVLDGSELTERLRRKFEQFALVEKDLLVRRETELQRSLLTLAFAIGAMTLFASAFVAYAARQMNAASRTAERAAREIQGLNRTLAERALNLELANRELEAFSYSVSHDLRAPLRHIQGYVELLERHGGKELAEKPRRYLKTISEAAGEMGQLIDDLLAFSRTGRAAMHETRVDLDAMIASTIAGLEMATKGRKIEWVVAPLPPVQGDAPMLKQVWSNLLGNAVKYTRHREVARIEVGARYNDTGRIEFFVRDNGVGFDMAHAGKLFGVFQRLHHADQFEGTGIGLATVQRVVARHGGRIWAEAVPGSGATFRFTLMPAAPAKGDA